MEKPMVSVVIPVYNAEKTIEKCLSSLMEQTVKNFEIIAINDGSSDNSLSILNNWAKKYSNIRVVDQENCGVAKTRNLGITLAESEYVMFVDNDDYFREDYIEIFFEEITRNNLDIVIGGYQRVNSSGKILHTEVLSNTEWSKYIIVAPWARIYRKSFLLSNAITFFNYGLGEDVVFSIVAYSKTNKIKVIPYVGYFWYYNEASVSNTHQRGLSEDLDLRVVMREIKSKSGDFDKGRIEYYLYRYLVWYMLFSGSKAKPEEFMRQFKNGKNCLDSEMAYKSMFFSKVIQGESFKNRFIVSMFYLLDKIKLLPIFSKLYCKGE
ncbi:glycosyltransferase family 2 protein [Streptococcus ruminantium]|uniref:glycosyltransferase family 2 protein n=1 Tax=Streptococcus ruminantium TaxID=1917441 RepID=UPI0012DED8B9|nr:glycosyltransferase [Streptococcus ruminantium]